MIISSYSHLVSLFTVLATITPTITAFTPTKPRTFTNTYTAINTEFKMASPQKGDVVTIDYEITPKQEDFVPTPLFNTGPNISFVLHKGNYLPGLHTLLSTMEVDQTVENVELDAGWGEPNPQLIATIPKEEGGGAGGMDYSKIEVGTELMLSNGAKCRVTEVTDTDFTIDANPPMAGASYTAKVTLKDVMKGPCEEKFEYREEKVVEEDCVYEVMTIALGCFWGGELEYMRVDGVVGTAVGYTQGAVENPTYQQVCSGSTQHTEGIQVIYDPTITSFESLLKIGLERLGDSKYLVNQVGNDRGTQYRHGVYYHNEEQKAIAEEMIRSYDSGKKECVTECLPAMVFYEAEEYHQQYLLKGGQSARRDSKETIRCYG